MTLLVKGGRVVNPAMQQDEICDILIENGKIKEVGANLSADGAEIVASEAYGVIDELKHNAPQDLAMLSAGLAEIKRILAA